MSILTGAYCKDVKGAATGYLLERYSVLPLVGKKCLASWRVYQYKRAHVTDIAWWDKKGWLKNVGIVCGAVSENLIVIDLDGLDAANLFKSVFGDLVAQTFTVKTGTGLHVYLHCRTLPANRKVTLAGDHSGIEVRGNGQYVVAPPSIHPDTQKAYEICVPKPVLWIDGLWDVQKWLDGLETPKTRETRPIEIREPSMGFGSNVVIRDRTGRMVKNPKAYANTALQSEIDRVGAATKGNQNNFLYAAAQRMGQFVSMGLLVQSEVVDALRRGTWRWTDSDQTEQEILNTIASGLASKAARDTR